MSKIVTASLRKIFVLVVIVLLQLGGASPITMAAPGVVRVGYDVTGVLLIKDQEGVFRGYNADFLYEIAKYTNWKYEFVPFNTWAGALQALEQGKIDVLPTVMKSPAREKTMLFANHWMGMMHVALVVPYDDKVHFYGDLAIKTIADVLKATGTNVAQFVRFEVGEGIEKKAEMSFAEEVAAAQAEAAK